MMSSYKKKTIVLVLASVVSIAGSFATEKYKNCVMGVDFESGTNGTISMVVSTKSNYSSQLSPIKKDANTYVLMLPEFYSSATSPNLSQVANVDSVAIVTMPYSSSSKGYTKITIKTSPNATLFAQSKIYIPAREKNIKNLSNNINNKEFSGAETNNLNSETEHYRKYNTSIDKEGNLNYETRYNNEKESHADTPTKKHNDRILASDKEPLIEQEQEQKQELDQDQGQIQNQVQETSTTDSNYYEIYLLLMGILLVLIASIWFIFRGRTELQKITGEPIHINTDEENKAAKQQALTTIKKKINKIDTQFPRYSDLRNIPQELNNANKKVVIEEDSIVDLDELLQQVNDSSEQNKSSTNTALEDYLESIFTEEKSNEQEYIEQEQNDIYSIDQSTYENTINNPDMKFSSADIAKINKLLNAEISEEAIQKLNSNRVTNPISEIISPQKRAENIITDYAVLQDITFSQADVEILYKLINIEIDPDFITDLRTNIKKEEEKQKTVSKEFKEHKNTTITKTPDLSKKSKIVQPEVAKKEKIVFCDTSYEVATLKVTDMPDLQEALKHPELYEDKKEQPEVNEDELINNLLNVQMKPFSDGQQFEVLNESNTSEENKVKQQQEKKQQQEEKQLKHLGTDTKASSTGHALSSKEDKNLQFALEGLSYSIIKTVPINDTVGCHLAKNEQGYYILSYCKDTITPIKHYKTLKIEKINLRLNDTLSDGTQQYLIKVGMNKFLVDVTNNNIRFVMDLC